MSDRWGQPGEGDREPAGSESPARKPSYAAEPSAASSALLNEFGRWLERWALYVRTYLALTVSGAAANPPAQDLPSSPIRSRGTKELPEHWRSAVTQGPPAHWLALLAGQAAESLPTGEQPVPSEVFQPQKLEGELLDVIHRFQTELTDFLGPPKPDAISTENHLPAPPGSNSAVVPGSGAGSADNDLPAAWKVPGAPWLTASGRQAAPVQPGQPQDNPLPVEPEFGPTEFGPAPVRMPQTLLRLPLTAISAHPAAPDVWVGSSSVPYNLQSGTPDQPPAAQPSHAPQAEVEIPPAQSKITRLYLSGSHLTGLGQAQEPAHPAVSLILESQQAGLPGNLSPTRASSIESEAVWDLQPLPEAVPHSHSIPLAQLEAAKSAPPGAETAFEPAQPEPPMLSRTLPVSWPSTDNQPHWPALPDPLPPFDPGPRPCQDAGRRSRIDREQGGGLWNE